MSRGRILIVEDDKNLRAIEAQILCNAGYSVTEAGSIASGLMHLDLLDLVAIVLDLRLPNGIGLRLVDTLKEKRNDVPVIVMSNFIKDKSEFEAEHGPMEWPIVDALPKMPPKPYELRSMLVEAVQKAFTYTQAIRSLRNSSRRIHKAVSIEAGFGKNERSDL